MAKLRDEVLCGPPPAIARHASLPLLALLATSVMIYHLLGVRPGPYHHTLTSVALDRLFSIDQFGCCCLTSAKEREAKHV